MRRQLPLYAAAAGSYERGILTALLVLDQILIVSLLLTNPIRYCCLLFIVLNNNNNKLS